MANKFNPKEYWDSKHKKYESLDWIDKPTIFAKEALKYFPDKGTILELGAGQGQDSRFFVQHGYGVISTDLSDYALRMNREKSKKTKLKYIIRQLDMSSGELPFNSGEFEVVFANLALQFFSDEITKKLFLEIWRVLKNGGMFAMLVNSTEDPEIGKFKKIAEGLYLDDRGLAKRYFDLDYLRTLTKEKFKTLVMDEEGTKYDMKKNQRLIRYIGQKTVDED